MNALSIALTCALLLLCQNRFAEAPLLLGADAVEQASGDEQDAPVDLDALQKQVQARPGWTDGWWQLSTAAYEANRYDIAIPALEKVVAASPRMGVAWNLLGLSEYEMGRYAPARRDLEEAQVLGNTNDPEVERVAAYHLALLYVRDKQFESANALLGRTFGAQPNAQVTLALGLAALQLPLLPEEVDPSQETLLQGAGDAVAKGKEGLPLWSSLTARYPTVALLHYDYAQALQRDAQNTAALSQLREECKTAPKNEAGWLALAELSAKEGRTEEARAANQRAAALRPTATASETARIDGFRLHSATHQETSDLSAAMEAYGAEKYADAAEKLKPWLAKHPEDGTSWAVLGLSEFQLHQNDAALLHLERGDALGMHAGAGAIETARYTAGELLLQKGEFERAAQVLAAAQKLVPADEKITVALGQTMLHVSQQSAVLHDGPALLRAAGQVEAELQESRYDEAFAGFRSLIQQYPQTPLLHYAYGTALIALSEFDEAAIQMHEELKLSPKSALVYERLASIALRQHKAEDALAPAREAIKLDPALATSHYLLGRALLEKGEVASATQELETANRLSPSSPEVHFSLARAYARSHRAEDAARERETFARLSELTQKDLQASKQQTYEGPRNGTVLHAPDAVPSPQ